MQETNTTTADSPQNGQCDACGIPLGDEYRAFALTTNKVSYPNDGRTPDAQAVLTYHDRQIKARFCCPDHLKKKLAFLLASQGIAAEAAHGRIGAGPMGVCGVCSKPVNMTEPHLAASKGKHKNSGIVHCDFLALICPSCSGIAESERARRLDSASA